MNRIARTSGLAALALTMSLGMAACGGDEADTGDASDAPPRPSRASESPHGGGVPRIRGADGRDGTFGEGCAAIPDRR